MNNSISEHIFQYGTKNVNYNLVRSRRVKTCEIIIDDENTVVIRSPYSKPIAEIEGLLKNKMNWISRKQIEYLRKEHRIEIIRPTFQNNSTVPYLGRNLKLNIIQSYSTDKDALEFKSNQLLAFIKTDNKVSASNYDTMFKTRVKSLYEKWLARQANDVFMQKVLEFSNMIKVNPNKIIIKNLKNRWGSATEKGTINLNINLLKAPEHVINYIIIHELCHLKIKKHSFHFWHLLSKYVPDYRQKVNWLEINSKSLIS
jgi:predicted metal-dependent hydrolase